MARYHEDYLEELEKDVEAARSYRYKRDREAYEYERELGSYRSYPPPHDDPYYRHYDELDSRMRAYPSLPPRDPLRSSLLPPQEDDGAYVYGSVTLIPPSPFEEKPKRNVKPPGCNTVFVGSLPDNMTEKHIIELFSECGRVVDVRIPRGKRYAHVEFTREEAVDKAIEVSNCSVRVGPEGVPGNTGRLYVDFAHHRGEGEVHKKIQEGEMMMFNNRSVTALNSNLHYDDAFGFAAKNVVHWFEKGHCDTTTANVFYSLLTNIHTHCRKMAKNIKTKDEEIKEAAANRAKFFEIIQSNLGLMHQIYEAATKQKAWDSFTKAQRKTITQWKEHATEVSTQISSMLSRGVDDGVPPAKIPKLNDTKLEADFERAQKEIEQLKTDHDVAIERKDREILLLKTLLDRFKQGCPEEWAKVTGEGTNGKPTTESKPSGEASGEGSEDAGGMEEEYEVLEGVGLDSDDNKTGTLAAAAVAYDNKAGTLAAAAAAYAQMRTRVGSTDTSGGLGLSDTEVAIASVLAAFLTVHPLGASLEEITAYFRNFNSTYNSYYLESLLCRLPSVFQMSQGAAPANEGAPVNKWWFLGFQTCSTVGSTNAMPTSGEGQATTEANDAAKDDTSST